MKKRILHILCCCLLLAQARATNYYTASAGATLGGNGTNACANWTTNPDGVTSLGTKTIAVTDNLFILSGATVTMSVNTSVANVTVSGGTATTLACTNDTLIITGNLSGTCKRTSVGGGLLKMTGAGKTLLFLEAAGSSAPITAYPSNPTNTGVASR